MKELRKVHTLRTREGDPYWLEIEFSGLKKGDIFRLFEDDGKPVLDGKKHGVCVALTDAEPCEAGEGYLENYRVESVAVNGFEG